MTDPYREDASSSWQNDDSASQSSLENALPKAVPDIDGFPDFDTDGQASTSQLSEQTPSWQAFESPAPKPSQVQVLSSDQMSPSTQAPPQAPPSTQVPPQASPSPQAQFQPAATLAAQAQASSPSHQQQDYRAQPPTHQGIASLDVTPPSSQQPQPPQQLQQPQQPQPRASQNYQPQQQMFQHHQSPQQASQQHQPPQQASTGAVTPPVSEYHRHVASSQVQGSRGSAKALAFAMGIVGVLVGAALTFGVLFFLFPRVAAPAVSETPSTSSYAGTSITVNPPSEDSSLAEVVAAKTLPSVVNIDVYATSGRGLFGDFDSGNGNTNTLEQYGLGSGIVISEDGYILTNYHVVEGGSEYLVRLDQDAQYKATVVGQDTSSDLAVLKVDAKGLIPVEIADSSEVTVGEWVMALGSPFGLEKSVSTGIVSALFRSTAMQSTAGPNFYANMIQTDAAINPGNSGGALVNSEGKLIGINTLINSSSGTSAGVGFAIPSNYAMNVARQIMEGKEVEHAYLGVQLQDVDFDSTSNPNSGASTGAYIGEVVPGSPADVVGLQKGDIVTKMDGVTISSSAELMINVRSHLVGDTVSLEVFRNNQAENFEITLGSDTSARS
jgi:putative serine protease PepD